jgi:5-methylcytosine-specific restriction endonuclease McrA
MAKPKYTRKELYTILKERRGLRCGICGGSLEEEWKELLLWHEHKHMKRTRINISIDHIIPKSKIDYKINWWEDLDNLQLTHITCNKHKGAKIYNPLTKKYED